MVSLISIALAAGFGVVVSIPLALEDQALMGAGMIAAAAWLARGGGEEAASRLAAISVAASARYLWWRITCTLTGWTGAPDVVVGASLLVAESYAFVMLLLGYFQTTATLTRRPVPLPEDPATWPTIDVLVPTYNEPLELVRTTLLAALSMDWPRDRMKVWLLDDGHRDEFRRFAREAGVQYLARDDNTHAKAGNLNHALARTHGEYVLILDCDHVPVRAFLQMTVGTLEADPTIAFVQTPHHFYSADPFERNLGHFRTVPNEGELFHRLIQRGNDLSDAAFFCGSCAVIRRSALEEVGGVAVETVTEDAHTALRLHRAGWHSAYLDVPLAAGLATESLSAHIRQRIRWARGMVQILRIDSPLQGRGLRWRQRLCYLAAMAGFLSGIPRIVFLTVPFAYLACGLHVFGATPGEIVAYAVPHLVLTLLASARIQGGVRHSFWSEVYETCLACYIALPTAMAMIDPRAGAFNVTAKGGRVGRSYFDGAIARPYLALLSINVVSIFAGLWRLSEGSLAQDVVLVNVAWAAQNCVVIGATIAACREGVQRRAHHRVPLAVPVAVGVRAAPPVAAVTVDASRGGLRLRSREGSWHEGERTWVAFTTQEQEVPLPVVVVGHAGNEMRVRFEPLTLEQELALVRAVFGRADAWAGWRQGRPTDQPIRSLVRVARSAVGLPIWLWRSRDEVRRPSAGAA
jgi:cellulose synthase (UDP-forming)